MTRNFLVSALFGLMGGFLGAYCFSVPSLQAAIGAGSFTTVQTYSGSGKRNAVLGGGASGQGSLFLFDERGNGTIQMGSYDRGGEAGQPLIGLNDRQGHLRFLFRLHNATDAPTLVMKDNRGRDKIVIGLDADQNPYFKYVTPQGKMKDLIQ